MSTFTYNGRELFFDTCPTCKAGHAFPMSLYYSAKANSKISIVCPHGHEWHYKSQRQIDEEAEVRRERDRLKQMLAQKDDEIGQAVRQVRAARGQVTRLRNRAKAGMCPCCNRHFVNLERHMASKHSEETVTP